MFKLLSRSDSNPKLSKLAGELGILALPLHLAPHSLATDGRATVCAASTPACRAACLHFAGNPAAFEVKHRARIEKTRLFFAARDAFLHLLALDIDKARGIASKRGLRLAIRLNATSDIPFERIPFRYGLNKTSVFEHFHDVQFYDYTKLTGRAPPPNLHLTFSLEQDGANIEAAAREYARGLNVAVIRDAASPLPDRAPAWAPGARIIDGDAHDFRFLDEPNSIVSLRFKSPRANRAPMKESANA